MKRVKCGIAVIVITSLVVSPSVAAFGPDLASHPPASHSIEVKFQALSLAADAFPSEGITKSAAITVARGAIPLRRAADLRSGRASFIVMLLFATGLFGGFIAFFIYGHFVYGDTWRNLKFDWQEFYWGTELGIPLTVGLVVSSIVAFWKWFDDLDSGGPSSIPHVRLILPIHRLFQSHLNISSRISMENMEVLDYRVYDARECARKIIDELAGIGLTDQQALFVLDKILSSTPRATQVVSTENRNIQSNDFENYTIETTIGPATATLEETLNDLIEFRNPKSASLKLFTPARQKLIVWIEEARRIHPSAAASPNGEQPSANPNASKPRRGFGAPLLMAAVVSAGMWAYDVLIGTPFAWSPVLMAGSLTAVTIVLLRPLISIRRIPATEKPAPRSPELRAA